MSLPGKLCIGILEEDNPLKSYFRFKPLLVEAEGRYVPFEEDCYPEEGCIRIVPDKNESYHFKARMRRMGLFCVVDLRAHPEENDKIRPNKNFQSDGAEINSCIIYSDVVREPAREMIFQLLPESARDEALARTHTPAVLLRGATVLPQRMVWQAEAEDSEKGRLTAEGAELPVDELQTFDLPGFRGETVSFAIVPAGKLAQVIDEAPVSEAKPRNTEKAQPKAEPAPEPAAAQTPAPQAPAEQEAPTKPWLHRDDSMLPPPVDPRLSPTQRILAAQSGLNPRRGRSLQELIDEKWQHSRMNQLGQPVGPITTGAPVASPVDCAVKAVRDVWDQPQLRTQLLQALSGIEEFGASLEECREAVRQRDIETHLQNLEARRLALMDELDRLRAGAADVKAQLKQEIRQQEAADLADAVQKTEAARREQARYEKLAKEARAAAADARKAVETATGEELERRLRDFALNEHMLERMAEIRGERERLPEAVDAEALSLEALAARVQARCEADGIALSRLEALNLSVCLTMGPAMFISGPVGSGKTSAARLLGEALGWQAAGRCAGFEPGKTPLADHPRLLELARTPDAPALLVLDDANLSGNRDPLRGLETALEHPEWRLLATLQDAHSGALVPANVLDKGFVVRLTPHGEQPWHARRRTAWTQEVPALLSAARNELLALPDNAVPEACTARMEALRKALNEHGAAVSLRALEDAWTYCGIMIASLGEETDPMAILDLAVAQRVLPPLLASAPIQALAHLPELLKDLPVSRALLDQPLPVMI